ncbi:hypothetical protein GCM10010912_64480 [Paenibacillus albidus]|uniref:Uncharacterized protein n=1 Tax=Paenibacillus albidus TaxID=2041023 RepID=A0A917D689_9BACL|nr:hypothetical protein [Paenibacillus albidus]GGG11174.1 hypothetical protein GCM10010912_64480 [Paenibacillus albidus]
MTIQIPDMLQYDGMKDFHIVGLDKVWPFRPEAYGLQPHDRFTACYRGYFCQYEVRNQQLWLKELCIWLEDTLVPVEWSGTWTKPDMLGCSKCRGVELSVPYTGKMLICREFVHKNHYYAGWERPIDYRQTFELELHEGRVIEVTDYSHMMEEVRGLTELGEREQELFADDLFTAYHKKWVYY